MRRVVLAVALTCALTPGVARAEIPPGQLLADVATIRAVNLAALYFGRFPACGRPVVVATHSEEGFESTTAAIALREDCAIVFHHYFLPGLLRHPVDFCSVLAHEFGHLLGLSDNTRPNSIMNTGLINPTPQCESLEATARTRTARDRKSRRSRAGSTPRRHRSRSPRP